MNGYNFLKNHFIENVVEPIKNHVKAKRYLARDNNYYEILSKASKDSRKLNMKCNENNKALFSVTGELGKKINRFYGDFYNFNPELFFKIPAKFNLNYTKQKISVNLNGDYNIYTNKNFTIEKLDLKSKNSSLKFLNDKKSPILETIFKGDFSWDKNLIIISRDVTLKNNQSSLRADVIEVDIKKKDIKIFMHEENKKVNIKSLKIIEHH